MVNPDYAGDEILSKTNNGICHRSSKLKKRRKKFLEKAELLVEF